MTESQMTDQQMIQRLYDLGHFHNPDSPTGIQDSQVSRLSLDDPEVVTAIKSFTSFMAPDFDRISLQSLGAVGRHDGQSGETLRKLFQVERCGCPDYAMETGSGSWPAGCHRDHPNIHTFTVSVDKSAMPAFLGNRSDPNSLFEQAWDLCQASYAEIGMLLLREDGNARANSAVRWQRGDGWIGLAIVPQGPRCGDTIWARFDNRYAPTAMLDQWARLLAHEFGHNMGMGHTRGGIMNPSIIGGKFTADEWRGDPAESMLTRFFGGEPIDLGDDPPVPPDGSDSIPRPGPGWERFQGSWAVGGKLWQHRGWSFESDSK